MSRTFRNKNNWKETRVYSGNNRVFGFYWHNEPQRYYNEPAEPTLRHLYHTWRALHGEGSKGSWNCLYRGDRIHSRKTHRAKENMKIKNMKTLDDVILLTKKEKIKY